VWRHLQPHFSSERRQQLKDLLEDLFDGDLPAFAPCTPWQEKMNQARNDHSETYDEVPCEIVECPECDSRTFGDDWFDRDADDFPSVEAWLEDPDVHAGYGPGSYFAHAMAKDD
jgi:hypothetical protein